MSGEVQDVVSWYPARLLEERKDGEPAVDALILLNQPLMDAQTLERIWKNTALHVAADGGANRLYDATRQSTSQWMHDLHVIIGDLDSLRDDVRAYYTSPDRVGPHERVAEVIHDPDQYSTDFAKAVKYIRNNHTPSSGAVDIVAMGGLGGRVDQGLSQLHHLFLFQQDAHYSQGRLYLVSGEGLTFLLKAGIHRIRVRERSAADVFDKYVGILPIGAPSVITTKGFEWDVTDWKTEFGGQVSTSNHVLPETEVIEVRTTSDVLFTIALKRAESG